MTDRDELEGAQLRDAALVRAAQLRIDRAIAGLVARPLDEAAAEEMRRELGPRSSAARAALRRLRAEAPPAPCGQPRLALVPDPAQPRPASSSPGSAATAAGGAA